MTPNNRKLLRLLSGDGPEDIVDLTDVECDALINALSKTDDYELIHEIIGDNIYLKRTRWGFLAFGLMLGFAIGCVFSATASWVQRFH